MKFFTTILLVVSALSVTACHNPSTQLGNGAACASEDQCREGFDCALGRCRMPCTSDSQCETSCVTLSNDGRYCALDGEDLPDAGSMPSGGSGGDGGQSGGGGGSGGVGGSSGTGGGGTSAGGEAGTGGQGTSGGGAGGSSDGSVAADASTDAGDAG